MGDLFSKISKITLNDTSSQCTEPDKEMPKASQLNLQTPKRVFDVQLLDPRSATLGIKRTPIVVLKTADSTNDTPLKIPKPYLETDLDAVPDDTTPKICKFSLNTSLEVEKKHLDEIVIDDKEEREDRTVELESSSFSSGSEKDEDGLTDTEEEMKVEEVPMVVVETPEVEVRPQLACPAKERLSQALYQGSPPLSTPVKLKSGRTPLGLVSVNAPAQLQSPVEVSKPWRGFQEERIRLGLENTPPCMTGEGLPDRVQSAPGKVGHKRRDILKKSVRAKTRWGLDDSVII